MSHTAVSHHDRALDVMRTMDAARHQRDHNGTMHNSVLDAEDELELRSAQLFTRKLHKELEHATARAEDLLETYENEIDYSAMAKKHNLSRYMRDCGLEVPLSMLKTDESMGNARAVQLAQDAIESVRNGAPDGMGPLFERFDLLVSRSHKVVEAAGVNADIWVPVVEPVMALLKKVISLRPVEQPLMTLSSEIQRLLDADEDLKKSEAQTVESGDLALNEEVKRNRIMLLEGLADLITQKFYILDGEEDNVVHTTVEELNAVRAATESAISRLHESIAGRRKQYDADFERLQAENRRAEADEQTARTSFNQDKARSDAVLAKNKKEQQDVWVEINALEDRLRNLARERREEIDRRVKMLEREERRKSDMKHFTEFARTHLDLLHKTLRSCEAEDLLHDLMGEVALGSCTIIERKLQQSAKGVQRLRQAAYQEHLSHFRRQYLLLGELTFKKERQLDEVQQRSAYSQAQQELAMDSFNPRAREYAVAREVLDEEQADMRAEIEQLHRKCSLYVEAFKPTEKALAAAGKTFVHPVQELIETNKERMRSIAAFHIEEANQAHSRVVNGVDVSPALMIEEKSNVATDKAGFKRVKPKPAEGRGLLMRQVDNGLGLE